MGVVHGDGVWCHGRLRVFKVGFPITYLAVASRASGDAILPSK